MPMDVSRDDAALLLPPGSRLLHIGPPKTGTTSLQSAFHSSRAAIAAQGVHYAGASRHSASAILAVTGRRSPYEEDKSPPMRRWHALVRDIRGAGNHRVVLSSEYLAGAEPNAIATIVRDIGAPDVHVVVTLRPLAALMPSQWQQYVQGGLPVSFDAWLEAMLNKPAGGLTPSFWMRHRHERLVARWAAVVGAANVTVIARADPDPELVLRSIERMTGLRAGTLVAERDLVNRSMTLPEIEAVRAFNIEHRSQRLGKALLSRVMHFGACQYLKRIEPDATWPRIEMPQWALERVAPISTEIVDGIAASGVRVIGDLEALAQVPPSTLAGERQPPVEVAPMVAARMAMGVLIASGLARERAPAPADAGVPSLERGVTPVYQEPYDLYRVPTFVLAGTIVRRLRASAVRRIRSIGRRADERFPTDAAVDADIDIDLDADG
jgi:hypothetical protein